MSSTGTTREATEGSTHDESLAPFMGDPSRMFIFGIKFGEELTEDQFESMVSDHFENHTLTAPEDSPFGLSGYVTRHGPTKIHMNAICVHNWVPFLMETTSEFVTCIFQEYTKPDSTIDRLVTSFREHVTENIEFSRGETFSLTEFRGRCLV